MFHVKVFRHSLGPFTGFVGFKKTGLFRHIPSMISYLWGETVCSPRVRSWTFEHCGHEMHVWKGCAIAQAVSCRTVTAHTCLRSQASAFEICGGQRNTGTGFSTSSSVCYHCSILAFMLMLLFLKNKPAKTGNLKVVFCRMSGCIRQKTIFKWSSKFKNFERRNTHFPLCLYGGNSGVISKNGHTNRSVTYKYFPYIHSENYWLS